MTKLKLLLLDANVIIECHRISVWNLLIEKAEIIVPSIVAHDEVLFSEKGKTIEAIHLPNLISNGQIKEYVVDIDDYAAVDEALSKFPIGEIHAGEIEALAIMYFKKIGNDYKFSTSDKSAIYALCALGLSDVGISLENILKQYGLIKQIRREYTEEYFKHHVEKGKQIRIQNL